MKRELGSIVENEIRFSPEIFKDSMDEERFGEANEKIN